MNVMLKFVPSFLDLGHFAALVSSNEGETFHFELYYVFDTIGGNESSMPIEVFGLYGIGMLMSGSWKNLPLDDG